MIHVCFGLHDADGRYSKFVGTAMASIFRNTFAPVTVHILHDATLTADNRDKFSYLAGRYGQHVNFHNIAELFPDEINFLQEHLADKVRSRFSIGAFYRLLIGKILGRGRAIYLDADVIVNLDIAELWQQDLKDFPLAAVSEIDATANNMLTNRYLLRAGLVRAEDYFCSGVLLLNLDRIDENFFYDGLKFLLENPACESPDQDTLNAFFAADYLKLDRKFDSFVSVEKIPPAQKIYHYAGNCFGLNRDNPYDRLWLENFALTPWLNLDAIWGLAQEIRNASDDLIHQMQWLINVSNTKRRAFFAAADNLPAIATLLGAHDDDLFIELRRISDEFLPASLDELIRQMNSERGKTVFFIFDMKYPYIAVELVKLGFSEAIDFVNGLTFLTRTQCGQPRPERHFIRGL